MVRNIFCLLEGVFVEGELFCVGGKRFFRENRFCEKNIFFGEVHFYSCFTLRVRRAGAQRVHTG